MTDSVDCQWIENNLEALFCERLEQEQERRARQHIEACEACRREVQAFNAIDPLVRRHFQTQMRAAQQRRAVSTGRVVGFSAAAASLVAVLLFVILRAPQPVPVAQLQPQIQPPDPVVEQAPAPAAVKDTTETSGTVERAKPVNQPDKAPGQILRALPPKSANAPDFLVMDTAGYSHKVEEFRGHVVVIAVWSGASREAIANFERLYKAHGSQSKFRFVGVSNERLSRPASTTFPVFYNQASKVFGLQPGEFVLLDENGGITLRGSLVKEFETLRKTLQGN